MNREMEILINDHPVRIELVQGRTKPKVACLGPEGTYTEAARYALLRDYLAEMEASFLPTNPAIVQQVDSEDFDLGIVAVENATEGNVHEVLREFNHARNITILGETILGIQHMLIGWPGETINTIYSHPQALGQCRTYLLNNLPDARQEASLSTAAAVEVVMKDKKAAAIASRRAAQLSNMPILAEDIGDIKGNSTRFLMIGRGETYPTGRDSTAVVFVPKEDQAGILARCLTTLASYGINLTSIESRPTGLMRQYAMWVNLEGHGRDENVQKGLKDLQETYCTSLRIVGSYRAAELPEGVREPGVINGQ